MLRDLSSCPPGTSFTCPNPVIPVEQVLRSFLSTLTFRNLVGHPPRCLRRSIIFLDLVAQVLLSLRQERSYTSPAANSLVWVDQHGAVTPVLSERAPYEFPRPSPDGKRIAFQLDDVWVYDIERSHDDRELFYRHGGEVWAVDVQPSAEFRTSKPRQLFSGRYEADIFPSFDVAPDGNRFLMVRSDPEAQRSKLHVVQNWFEELRQRVPANK